MHLSPTIIGLSLTNTNRCTTNLRFYNVFTVFTNVLFKYLCKNALDPTSSYFVLLHTFIPTGIELWRKNKLRTPSHPIPTAVVPILTSSPFLSSPTPSLLYHTRHLSWCVSIAWLVWGRLHIQIFSITELFQCWLLFIDSLVTVFLLLAEAVHSSDTAPQTVIPNPWYLIQSMQDYIERNNTA